MNPEFIDRLSLEMAEVYGAITDQILINLAHYFPFYNARTFPRSSITYQADMLAQMGQVNRDTMAIIRRNLHGVDQYLSAALEQVIIDSVEEINPDLLTAVKRDIFRPAGIPQVSPNQMRAFKLYHTQAAEKLNLVNTVMLESTRQAYQATVADVAARIQVTQTAIDIGAGETITGVSAWNKATQHAIDRLKAGGITGFIDHAGRHWSAEAYVAMDIRTTMFNTGRAAVWETNETFGNDLYQVSYHNGARPLCYPWQNKVISANNVTRTVTDLDGNEIQVIAQSATSYGQPAGLFGINCKHYPNPFIPGVSIIRGEPQDEAANEKTYAESQYQRGLERKIREQKRDLLMMKERGEPDAAIKAQRAKIRETDDEIDAFCQQTGRARRQNRESVYTKREFPDAQTYDVTEFENSQRDMIKQYFEDGGAQQNYTIGQMQQTATQINAGKVPQSSTKATTQAAGDRTALLEKYDKMIADAEEKRLQLLMSGNEDFEAFNRIDEEIEWTERKKKIIADGGHTLEEAVKTIEPFVVNPGSNSEIPLAKADIYTMPDGKKFVFKHAMNKAHQSMTPDVLITKYYELPAGFREKAQDVIAVVDRYNPQDSYWKKAYKGFTQSYATGGEQMTLYRWDHEHDLDYLMVAFEHEAGHLIDRNNAVNGTWFSDLQEWITAMDEDKAVSGLNSWRSYGENSRAEDFADSVAYYLSNHDEFVQKMPNRSAIIERLLNLGTGGS